MEQGEFKKVCFITEAESEIGYGHLFRCLALAKEFIKRKVIVDFIVNDKSAETLITNQIEEVKIQSLTILETEASIYNYIIIDVFKETWVNYKELVKGGNQGKFVSIIDYAFIDYAIETDFIFAIGLQTYNFKEECLIQEKKIKMFSGNDFFIFREEFSKVDPPETKSKVSNIFISMGGSDPLNLTFQAINGIDKVDGKFNLKIILGAGYNEDRIKGLKNLINKSKHDIKLYKNTSNISTLMAECELAIINGGNTRFELAYLGIPFISIAINQKQNEISNAAEKIGLGINLGVYNEISNKTIGETLKHLILHFEKRKTMSLKMKKMVNKNGAKRIHELLF